VLKFWGLSCLLILVFVGQMTFPDCYLCSCVWLIANSGAYLSSFHGVSTKGYHYVFVASISPVVSEHVMLKSLIAEIPYSTIKSDSKHYNLHTCIRIVLCQHQIIIQLHCECSEIYVIKKNGPKLCMIHYI
jgi:hypothetical protein